MDTKRFYYTGDDAVDRLNVVFEYNIGGVANVLTGKMFHREVDENGLVMALRTLKQYGTRGNFLQHYTVEKNMGPHYENFVSVIFGGYGLSEIMRGMGMTDEKPEVDHDKVWLDYRVDIEGLFDHCLLK